MNFNIEELLEYAIRFTKKAGDHTLQYFNQKLAVEYKGDNSPVTRADREAELILRDQIMDAFPDHGILGEEFGVHNPDAAVQWILDPVDGTLSFIHGIPLYTTLVGVVIHGDPQIGIVYAPALNEMADAAVGLGARLNGSSISVRKCDDLSKATLLTTDIKNIKTYGFESAHTRLMEATHIHRTWGDAYGHMMVATGRADIMIDPILNIWDAAPLTPLLREAGGIFMNKLGVEDMRAGHGISTSIQLRDQVLKCIE
jgi:myo-inositol-1(or 4)-monophosphatase